MYGLDEEPDFIAVTKKQAEWIRRLAALASEDGDHEPRELTQQEQEENRAKADAYEKAAEELDGIVGRLRQLNSRDKELVLALIELIEFGDGGCEHGSWVLSIVRDFLSRVAWFGPGGANELPFGRTLLEQVEAYDYFESWIEDARRMTARYPGLLKSDVRRASPALPAGPASAARAWDLITKAQESANNITENAVKRATAKRKVARKRKQ